MLDTVFGICYGSPRLPDSPPIGFDPGAEDAHSALDVMPEMSDLALTGALENRLMNRRNCASFTLITAIFFLTGSVSAQIANQIKLDPNVTPHLPTIDAAVKAQVAKLRDPQDPAAMAAARAALIGFAAGPAGQPASPSYLDALAASINTNILPLAKEENLRVRLNAAIAVARVAEVAANTRLMTAALAFLNDKSEPVALWGLKASRPILVQVLNTLPLGIKEFLPEAAAGSGAAPAGPISRAVERFQSGLIAQEAYHILALNLIDSEMKQTSFLQVVPELLRTLEHRVKRAATAPLAEPRADTQATLYLSNGRIWNGMTPAQRRQTMQLLSDLIWLQAQWASRIAEQSQRQELVEVINRIAAAIDVIGESIKDANLRNAVAAARQIGASTPAQQIPSQVQGIFAAIQANADFKDLKPPPSISQAAAAPATTQTQTP